MVKAQNKLWVLVMTLLLGGLASSTLAEDQLVWNGTEWVSPKPAEPGTAEGDLEAIRQMVETGQNKRVIKTVEAFLVAHGDSPACEEAMNLAGQSLMNRGEYWDAYKWFERQISTYPNGAFFERALDREYQIADAYINGRKRKAMKIFRVPADDDGVDMLMRISAHCPGTPISERALLRVAEYHFNRQEYPEAVACYEDFMKDNPLSEHRKFAMLQVARAYLLSYRGTRWDSTPLLDARKRYQLFAQAYPRDAEKENVEGILEEIRLGLAQKVYETGRFYERTKYPRAAAYYYNQTIDQYPDTHWANSAKGRLEMLGTLPTDAQPYTPETHAQEMIVRGEVETRDHETSAEDTPAPVPAVEDAPVGAATELPEVDLPASAKSSPAAPTASQEPPPLEDQDTPNEQPVPLEELPKG